METGSKKSSREEICGKRYVKEREECGKNILRFHLVLSTLGLVGCIAAAVWDLTHGNQSITGRCVWAGYCIWKGTISSGAVCLVAVIVNLLALSGLYRANSWFETKPRNSYRFILPWLVYYFLINLAILPVCIYFLYAWYRLNESKEVLYIHIPIIGVLSLFCLLLSLHLWYRIMVLCLDIRERVKVDPFVRVGDRVVLGLDDYSTLGKRSNATLSVKKSKVVGHVTFTEEVSKKT